MQGKSKYVFFKLSVTISDLEYFFAIHWTLVKIADEILQKYCYLSRVDARWNIPSDFRRPIYDENVFFWLSR